MTDRLYEVATDAHLNVVWHNGDGTPSIYTTADASQNQITIEIANKLGEPLGLPAGEPVAFGQLQSGQTAVYVFLNGLIPNEAIDAAALAAASGFTTSAHFSDRAGRDYLVIAPSSDTQLDDGGKLQLKLTGLAPATGRSGYATVLIDGTGLSPDQVQRDVYVNSASPPQPGKQDLDLIVGFAEGDEVYTGADQGPYNELLLFLTNPGAQPLVPKGSAAWDMKNLPTFQLDLVAGSGQGALTDPGNASQIDVAVSDDYGNGWNAPQKNTQGGTTYWTVQPNPDKPSGPGVMSGTVLGTGESASVVLGISNIVTELPQGLTYANLSWKNIPGYNDGFFALEILKVDPIKISPLTASPNPVTGATGPTQVTLDLTVENATYVTIPGTGYGKPTNSTSFTDTAQVTVDETETLTLIAVNYGTGQLVSESVTVDVQPAAPTIESFTATGPDVQGTDPPTIPPRSYRGVWLSFKVTGATFVMITNTSYAKATGTLGEFGDSTVLGQPGAPESDSPISTSMVFNLIAFNTNTGQVASESIQVQVSPDPVRATMIAGEVDDGPNQSPSVVTNGNVQGASVTRDQYNTYTISFPVGTFTPTFQSSPQMVASTTMGSGLVATVGDVSINFGTATVMLTPEGAPGGAQPGSFSFLIWQAAGDPYTPPPPGPGPGNGNGGAVG